MDVLRQNQPVVLDPAPPYIAPGALGTVGNLQYRAQDGGTARASSPSMRERIRSWCTDLSFLCCVSDEAHYQHDDEKEVFENSRCVGNLLGSLTAHVDNEEGLRDVAKRLTKLGEASKGDLGRLQGGRESLSAYMDRLTDSDIRALRAGPLDALWAREVILNQIERGKLRAQAYLVLRRVREAFEQREARDALGRIAEMALDPMYREALKADLELVHKGMGQLQSYLLSLPIDKVRGLQAKMFEITWALHQQRLAATQDLINRADESKEKQQAREVVAEVYSLIRLISIITSRFPNVEELNSYDRNLNLEVAEVKVG